MHGGPGESCISFGLCLDSLRTLADVIETDQRAAAVLRRAGRGENFCKPGAGGFRGNTAPLPAAGLDRLGPFLWRTARAGLRPELPGKHKGRHPGKSCGGYPGRSSLYPPRLRELFSLQRTGRGSRPDGSSEEEKDIVKCLDAVNAVADHDKQRFWSNHLLSEEAARLLDMSRLPIEQRLRCVSFFHRMKRDESFSRNGWELLKSLGCPILLLCGEKDRILDGQLLEVFQSSQKCGRSAMSPAAATISTWEMWTR